MKKLSMKNRCPICDCLTMNGGLCKCDLSAMKTLRLSHQRDYCSINKTDDQGHTIRLRHDFQSWASDANGKHVLRIWKDLTSGYTHMKSILYKSIYTVPENKFHLYGYTKDIDGEIERIHSDGSSL